MEKNPYNAGISVCKGKKRHPPSSSSVREMLLLAIPMRVVLNLWVCGHCIYCFGSFSELVLVCRCGILQSCFCTYDVFMYLRAAHSASLFFMLLMCLCVQLSQQTLPSPPCSLLPASSKRVRMGWNAGGNVPEG